MISLIAAIGKNRELGYKNSLIWRIPADQKRFKQLTTGHTVVMGRKTYESIGRPLPDRKNIIITTDTAFAAGGCEIIHSLDPILHTPLSEELFILGGADIYRQTIPHADRLYLTVIDADAPADAFFPEYDKFSKVVSSEDGEWDGIRYHFINLEKLS